MPGVSPEPAFRVPGPPTEGKRAVLERVLRRAASAGLSGPLVDLPDYFGGASASTLATSNATALDRSFHQRVSGSRVDGAGRLDTALSRWETFRAKVGPSFVDFVQPAFKGDSNASMLNVRTLGMFAESIRQDGSMQRGQLGRPIRQGTVSSLVSAISMHRGLEAGVGLVSDDQLLAAVGKQMRDEDGPGAVRKHRTGVRAADLREAVARGFDISSTAGVVRWAMARIAHNCLMRGIELGRGEKPTDLFDAKRGLCVGHFVWRPALAALGRRPILIVWMVPAKDPQKKKKRMPVPIMRRLPEGEADFSGRCTYEAVRRAWLHRSAAVPRAEWLSTPFFVRADGEAVSTADVRKVARDIRTTVGKDASEVGAHSFRIAGATDLLCRYGPDRAPAYIKKRGRWDSDIGEIYSRADALGLLQASVDMEEADGIDFESLVGGGWAQPI